jgi:uncharacterized protein (TIGR02996 family)
VEAAFLAALHAEPNDEATWLALADWLDEDGQADPAELVRLVRHLRALPVMRRSKDRARLEDRVAELLDTGVRPVAPEVINLIGMRLALLLPGRFLMGSPSGEKERGSDEEAHAVELTKPFSLGVFAVTQGPWLMSVWRGCWQQGRSALDFSSQLLRGTPVETRPCERQPPWSSEPPSEPTILIDGGLMRSRRFPAPAGQFAQHREGVTS